MPIYLVMDDISDYDLFDLYLRDNRILFSQIFTIGYLSIVTICPI